MKDVRDALMVARRSDGKLVRRPLSPHLQVYRWPVSMALSISHRITGVGLSVGALLMTWWLVAAAASESAFATVQGFLGSGFGVFPAGVLGGGAVAASVSGHPPSGVGCGLGVRILAPTGAGASRLENRTYRLTGWGVIGASVMATLIVWIIGFVVW